MSDSRIHPSLAAASEHFRAGDFAQAEQIAREVIAADPNSADAIHLLGMIAHATGHFDVAVKLMDRSIQLNPSAAGYFTNFGDVLRSMNRLDDAVAAFTRAVELSPQYGDGYNNLSVILQDVGRHDEAVAVSRRAILLRPDDAVAYNNLGNALFEQGKFSESLEAFRESIRLRPDYAEAYCNFANVLKDSGHIGEAIENFRRALQHKPDYPKAHGNLLLAMQYDPDCSADAIWQEHQNWAKAQENKISADGFTHANDRDPHRRLRIGLFSPDFKNHPVGFFIEAFLKSYDRSRIELFGYSDATGRDPMTDRLAGYFDHWRVTRGMRDADLADVVHADQIDVLVDLAGHTAGSRLAVFAHKPAPVQLSYLGYPNTTGLATIDYRIVDSFTDPPGAEKFYSEKIIRIDPCFLCYTGPTDLRVETRQSGPITFASFNAFAKITPAMIAIWSDILRSVPDSRLMLKARSLADQQTRRELEMKFASHEIQGDRLNLRGWTGSYEDHLRQYNAIDIALDTFPYHGTTTTCEAMWMGVPVVTLAGETHRSRVGVSLLSNVGLPELIAHSPREYLEIAIKLAGDRARLAELRSTLRQRMQQSPLTDSEGFTRRLETAFFSAWKTWCESPPNK